MHLGKDIYVDKRDLRYLWYLPVYILAFVLIERVNIGAQYHEIHMFLDDLIPFSEYFIVPYLSWHVLTFVVIGWLLIRDPAVYRKMMTFFIVASILCFVIFLAYPSYQTLRPETFERHNVFTWAVSLIYAMDTPTNICPSMHVIGSLGLLLAVFETKEDMRMPVKTVLKITYTEPGEKGNTATNATKPATVETGATVRVPLFINEGELIEVDTRDGSYVNRAK